jgi:hypothetical protein
MPFTPEPCEVQGCGSEKKHWGWKISRGFFVEVLERNFQIQVLNPMRGGKT